MINMDKAKKYCRDDISKIENYEEAKADTTQTWACHHRLGLTHSRKKLARLGLYENRPAEELIFLTPSEHSRLHNMHMSDETRKKMTEAMKGKPHGPMSAETRRKISEARKAKPRKPLSDETKKKLSEASRAYWARRKANAAE